MIRPTIWVRAGYWWHFAGVACFMPFIALHYRQLGLSGFQIGVLAAILPLGVAFLAPIWGAIADKYAAHRLVLRSSLALAALSALLLTRATTFVPIMLLITWLAIFVAPIPSMLDGYAVTLSEQEGHAYGHLRVWGSIGFVVAAWFIGKWMGVSVSRFFFVAYATCLLLTLGTTLGFPQLNVRSGQPMRGSVKAIVRNRAVLLLLLTTYLVSTSTSFIFYFFGIYVDELGGSAQLLGTTAALAAISEMPVLLFGAWLLARLDNWRVLALAITIYIVRFLLYSVVPSPGWILPVQVLHGLSFGAYLMASVTLMHELVGHELAVTAQALLGSVSFGFGSICGSLIGGALLDLFSFPTIFRLASIAMLLVLGLFLAGTRRLIGKAPSPATVLQPREDQAT